MTWMRTDSAKLEGVSQSTSMLRTCVGCGIRAQRSELIRVVASTDGHLHVDDRRQLPGRGAWFHPETRCLDLARTKRAMGRSLRRTVEMTDQQWKALGEAILSAAHRAPDNE